MPYDPPASGRIALPVRTCWIALLLVVLALAPMARLAGAQGADGDSDSLVGAYAVSITEEDVPLSLIGSATLQGAWVVTFETNGSYTIERQDVGAVVTGRYDVAGEEVSITDESGLLSCANPQPIGDTGPTATYSWQKTGDLLRLEAIDDTCSTRQVLLTTRALAPFIACRTVAVDLLETAGTPSAGADGVGRGLEALRQAEDDEATPDASEATPVAEERVTAIPAAIGTADDPEEAITEVIAQLNACWATGDPARVLPLFSESFVNDATGGGSASLEDLAAQLRQLQTATIMWELAGDIEVDGDEAAAVVAATIGSEETLDTFTFVRENDAWRLNDLGQ